MNPSFLEFNPVLVTISVPWMPKETAADNSVISRYVTMPIVAWTQLLDFNVTHGAN